MELAESQPDDCHRPRGADRTGRAAMEPTGDRPDDLVKDVAETLATKPQWSRPIKRPDDRGS